MNKRIQAVKGMPDILPKDILLWQEFEALWRKLMRSYGYEEIRFPIIEETGLFKRSIGEVTDIVEKEMFTFQDKDLESLTLRPEGTAGCVRAGLEHGLIYHNFLRLWYMGPMFRYERPQKGRYRQFHQVGVEAFGFNGPDIEVEQVLLMARFWQWFLRDVCEPSQLKNVVRLEINTLGSKIGRDRYRQALVDYFLKVQKDLDEDSQRRLHTNPLRILDSKNPLMQKIIEDAPKGLEFLEEEDRAHFESFHQLLIEAQLPFSITINPHIVRGLDYYNRTVYEWVTDHLGSQNAVCAGGRYDSLLEQLGGEKTPASGFAVGIERAILLKKTLMEKANILPTDESLGSADIYLIHVGEKANKFIFKLSEKLRNACDDLKIVQHCGGGNFKAQFKRADKSGAKVALILGDSEVENNTFSVKFLREERNQEVVSFDKISHFLNDYFQK